MKKEATNQLKTIQQILSFFQKIDVLSKPMKFKKRDLSTTKAYNGGTEKERPRLVPEATKRVKKFNNLMIYRGKR